MSNKKNKQIPFNKPFLTGKEIIYLKESLTSNHWSGDGPFTKKCQQLLQELTEASAVLLTHSCTAALEMSALLLDISTGDEIILPSYAFPSTVNAFILRGACPVFVDIREDTLNLDESKIEEKITAKTKAICLIHYAGIGCEMDPIMELACKYKISVIEDAAQALSAKYKKLALGSIGQLGTLSFHETKNCICGEGGALLINDASLVERAEIIREKGTNRTKFFKGEVDKYTWVDIGSSFLPSDLLAAVLCAQLENIEEIQSKRKKIYQNYFDGLRDLEVKDRLRLPIVPKNVTPNFHMFYIILPSNKDRDTLMAKLQRKGIKAIFHYLPLHLSEMGKRFGYKQGDFFLTEVLSGRILRLPFYNDLSEEDQKYIIETITGLLSGDGC